MACRQTYEQPDFLTVDKQFRISRYVIEERLGGPITWPIPGYHHIANTQPADSAPEPPPAKPTRRIRSYPLDAVPGNQLRLFPL